MRYALATLIFPLFLVLSGCGQGTESASTLSAEASADDSPASADTPSAPAEMAAPAMSDSLATILEAQPDAVKARYEHRHPQETLEFFGIEPGMTVGEALPGGGWYSKILLPYLGSDGALVGIDYPLALWPNFAFADADYLATKATWVADWTAQAQGWRGSDDASVSAFVFGAMPESAAASMDAVLLIRALHNLARFSDPADDEKNYLQIVLNDIYRGLKPGGVVGIVQHEAREDMPDAWATGAAGYLKKSFVIAQMEAAGFEFVSASDINSNPADQPTTDDIVWRLPPSLATSGDNPTLREEMLAIGESNRMTLKFVKPAVDEAAVGG
ncbi:MAG: class I SAM-dependent methyltransferase [bacterium]